MTTAEHVLPTEHVLQPAAAHAFALGVLRALGMPEEDRTIVADSMVWSGLRGDTGHSLMRLNQIARYARAGGLALDTDWTPVRQHGPVTVLDAGNTWGVVAGTRGMRHAVAAARTSSVGVTTVRNCDNTGALGWFTSLAVEERMIGLAVTNGSPLMPLAGAAPSRVIGNQAYSIATPAGRYPPVNLDTALSMTWHALRKAAAAGEQVAPGLVLNAAGEPTVDPAEGLAGILLPIGGHRGSGLALMWEVLTSVLSGGRILTEIGDGEDPSQPIGNSLFLLAIDPSAFMLYEEYVERVDRLIDLVHAAPPAPGVDHVRVPGEHSEHTARQQARTGIPFPADQVANLRALADELAVPWPGPTG